MDFATTKPKIMIFRETHFANGSPNGLIESAEKTNFLEKGLRVEFYQQYTTLHNQAL